MNSIFYMIKPASSLCNMRCSYCFYADVSSLREVESFGLMSSETAQNLIRQALATGAKEMHFAFQGGEPTLAGLAFYRDFVTSVNNLNTDKIPVYYSIQSNGYLIDDAWADFFAEHKFLVGISLDGTVRTHNVNRLGADGEGTFRRVWQAIERLREKSVDFNILTVVNAQTAQAIERIYHFYIEKDFLFQQYIPCLDPLEENPGTHEYSLTPEMYGDFLIRLFDLWFEDVVRGKRVSIRFFDNLLTLALGNPPEACGMLGFCQQQLLVEADGGVYPCDFYVLDHLLLGNVNQDSLEDIERMRAQTEFIAQSKPIAEECKSCRYFVLCRGGCRRNREPMQDGKYGLNYFCPSYKSFFQHAWPKIEFLVQRLKGG